MILKTVRSRITVVATLVVALTLVAGVVGLIAFSRVALISDVRTSLTDNLSEARTALDRGVVTELGLLQLGQAIDPFEATTRIADQACASILAEAYGDDLRPAETYYYFEDVADEVFFAYDDCVFENDPFYESVSACETEALDAWGTEPVTFAEFQEILDSEAFDRAFDQCIAGSLVVDQRVQKASGACQPVIDAAFDGLDVLDEQTVQAATANALIAYSECMRSNGVPDYPDLFPTAVDNGSVLSGVAGSAIVLPSLDSVRENVDRVSLGVVLGLPVLVALLGVLVWAIVGRALRPVEQIRSRVAEIGASRLDQRVPEPAGDDEVARLAVTMNEMLSRLERSAVRQRQFVSDASHELRSPIASIRTQMEVALAHPERADWADVAGGVLEEGLRMERLVDDLLTLARADAGVISARSERVDMGEVTLAEAERHEVIDTTAVKEAVVTGDQLALRRVVRNLFDNAVRHSAGRVEISVTAIDGYAVVSVEDDGPGIAIADRERVFERFARLDEGRQRDQGGTGLGLAVVRDVVTGHGGSVAALTGERLGGARFVVRIPLADRT